MVSPRLGRLNERTRVGSVVIDRRKTHTNHTRRHNITTGRQPERKDEAGSGGNISQKAYKAHLEEETISPRFDALHVVGHSGPMLACAKTKSNPGSKVDGLWTAKSGHAERR